MTAREEGTAGASSASVGAASRPRRRRRRPSATAAPTRSRPFGVSAQPRRRLGLDAAGHIARGRPVRTPGLCPLRLRPGGGSAGRRVGGAVPRARSKRAFPRRVTMAPASRRRQRAAGMDEGREPREEADEEEEEEKPEAGRG